MLGRILSACVAAMNASAGRHRPLSERLSSRRPDSESPERRSPSEESGGFLLAGADLWEAVVMGAWVFFVLLGFIVIGIKLFVE